MNRTAWISPRLAAWAGILAPVLFVGIFTLEGWLRPGYNALAMFISVLSLGTRGWIQMTNFLLLGGLLLVFSRGVAAEFPTGKASRSGVILLTTLSALFLVSGPFVMDPTGTPPSQMTVHGTIHGLAGGFVFLLMPILIFVFLRRFRIDPKWRSLYGWTLALGVIEAVADLIFIIVSKAPELTAALGAWMGLIQRTALVPFMAWVFIFGLELLRRINREVV
jgi:hypothetical protein